jgi:hypothetical protein
MTEEVNEQPVASREHKKSDKKRLPRFVKTILSILVSVLILAVTYFGYLFIQSPEVIRNPQMNHYHFRMQILVDGKAEDFGSQGYQQGYAKDQCNANLAEQPIHFHDNKDQFTHIHWSGMTGGMVMKYYGWNYIGGLNNALGYTMNDLADIQQVTIHGNYLPSISKDAKFYIYTGDESSYVEKSFADWRDKDLEEFFGTASNFPKPEEVSVLDLLFPPAYAHGTADDADGDDGTTETELQKLTRINNLIGNVVIFVQPDAPSEDLIKSRFDQLVPLNASTCGG